MSERARVSLDGDELSFLIGLLRVVSEESDELLEEPIPHDRNGEERAWVEKRGQYARELEAKLERAGRRL